MQRTNYLYEIRSELSETESTFSHDHPTHVPVLTGTGVQSKEKIVAFRYHLLENMFVSCPARGKNDASRAAANLCFPVFVFCFCKQIVHFWNKQKIPIIIFQKLPSWHIFSHQALHWKHTFFKVDLKYHHLKKRLSRWDFCYFELFFIFEMYSVYQRNFVVTKIAFRRS